MKFIKILILFLLPMNLWAQDIHYSQFYETPLLINPSLTGHIEGSYRVKAIYRNQWGNITAGGVYSTPAVSFDMNFKQGDSRNTFGGGLALYNDQTGDDHLSTLGFFASAAYHLSLDKKEMNYLSFGIQGGYINKQINPENIVFFNQFDSNGNPTGSSGENFDNTSISGTDLRFGITYSNYSPSGSILKLGAAYMHILKFQESFLGDTENALPGRLVLHGEAKLPLSEKFGLMPNFLFMNQTSISEINVGSNVLYQVSPDIGAMLGAGFRFGDAAIFVMGFNFKGANLGFSYDFNVSDLSATTNNVGGFEVSLGYIGRIVKPAEPIYPAVRYF